MVIARVRTETPHEPAFSLKSALVLEDGTVFEGRGFGFPRKVFGEVVFNTGMVGYAESLTDPSYFGQILVQTYPLIGNYGVPADDARIELGHFESDRVQVRGYVVSNLCQSPSHWSASRSINDWLNVQRTPGMMGIDTRELTKRLRTKGTMLGVLEVTHDEPDIDGLLKEVSNITDPNRENLVKEVSVNRPVEAGELSGKLVALIDCGVKYSIVRNLLIRGFRVVRLPYDTSASDVLEWSPNGIVVSNGPGDPKMCPATVRTLADLNETHLPVLGICLGLQLLAIAEGADTYKMKFGHRGQNHPCIRTESGNAWITSQNHGFAVNPSTLVDTQLSVNMIHANDGTVEGIIHKRYPIRAVQFHPEASPGPVEASVIFDEFAKDVRLYRD